VLSDELYFYDNRADSAVTGRRCRVNGRLLTAGAGTSAAGAPVVLLGRVASISSDSPTGSRWTVTASDSVEVRVAFARGATAPEVAPGQLVEIVGLVASGPIRRSESTESATVFSDSQSSSFDMDLYNSAVEITERLPRCYYTASRLDEIARDWLSKRNRTIRLRLF
uniref:OB domain-containing protein n=1 Tax=Macrostomum lignano TaxID=282301 RepID=A0A1I8IPM4_9PLAT